SEHHPSRIPGRSVAYTGTHDNDTARGWFASLDEEERERVLQDVRRLVGASVNAAEVHWAMIRALYATPAARAIVPVQDVLGLESEARMNTPSQPEGNWSFRISEDLLTPELARRLRGLAVEAGRAM